MRERANKEIRDIMAKNQITKQYLADKLGVHINTLTGWLNSELVMTEERRERVLRAIESIIANDEREGA